MEKLMLDQLKVQSFVTEFKKENGQTLEIVGGLTDEGCLATDYFCELLIGGDDPMPSFPSPNPVYVRMY